MRGRWWRQRSSRTAAARTKADGAGCMNHGWATRRRSNWTRRDGSHAAATTAGWKRSLPDSIRQDEAVRRRREYYLNQCSGGSPLTRHLAAAFDFMPLLDNNARRSGGAGYAFFRLEL